MLLCFCVLAHDTPLLKHSTFLKCCLKSDLGKITFLVIVIFTQLCLTFCASEVLTQLLSPERVLIKKWSSIETACTWFGELYGIGKFGDFVVWKEDCYFLTTNVELTAAASLRRDGAPEHQTDRHTKSQHPSLIHDLRFGGGLWIFEHLQAQLQLHVSIFDCLSSVHPMSCSWCDIGYTEEKQLNTFFSVGRNDDFPSTRYLTHTTLIVRWCA